MGAVASSLDCKCALLDEDAEDKKDLVAIETVVDTSDTLRQVTDTSEKALMHSSKTGDVERVKVLLRDGASLKSVDKRNRTALHLAAGGGHQELAKFLLKKGSQTEVEDDYGRTPLLMAVEKGHLELAKCLLHKGAARSPLDLRLLEVAREGQTALAKDLILCGAKLSCKDEVGHTPLHKAAYHGHLETTKLLLDEGAKTETKSKNGSAAMAGAAKQGHLDVVRLLVNSGARLHSYDKQSLGKKLVEAVAANNVELTRQLLIYDASTRSKDKDGRTPLLLAAEKGYAEIGVMLANWGLSDSDKLALGKLLLIAAGDDNTQYVKLLLECFAGLEVHDYFNETPLWRASLKGNVEIVKLLLDKNPQLDPVSRNCCRTPLGAAIDRGNFDTARLLLNRGASCPDVVVLDRKLRESSTMGDVDRVRTLLYCRAHVDAMDSSSETPLHNAASNDRLEVARILLDGRADVQAKSGNPGRTPLYHAASAGSMQTVQLLMEHATSDRDREGHEKARTLLGAQGGSLLQNASVKR